MKKLVSFFGDFLLKKPFLSLLGLGIILFLSYIGALKLSINSNQIDLLPPEYPEVIKTKKVVEMIGGNGFYIIAMKIIDEKGMQDHLYKAYAAKRKGKLDLYKQEISLANQVKEINKEYYKEKEKILKESADELSSRLLKEKDVRYISYKYDDVSFLQNKFPLFIQTEDVQDVRNRINKKIDHEKQKLNPFYMDLGANDFNPDFTDILEKYSRLSKRDIFDAYNISPDKGMLLLLVKPAGSFVDMEFTKQFEKKVIDIEKEFNFKDRGIKIGYTGTYKLNLDDYESLIHALKPVSMASLIGIIVLLLLFFRNPVFIIILTLSLLSGILITFGLTGVLVGRLNTVTSIMAAVLMGLGIDYGIQFMYRFREEFTLRGDFLTAVKETIYHTGMASLITAFTTTSAFVVLMFSEFRGFSEFGFIACYGIIVIALCMYFVTAIQIAILLRLFPSINKMFIVKEEKDIELGIVHRIFSNPRKVLILSGIIIIVLSAFSPLVQFNYSGRDLLLENQESLLLYDEIGDRFDVSSDPQVIVVDTLEESEAVFDYFNPVQDSMKDIVDQIVSVWNVLPGEDQQQRNIEVLKQIKKDIKPIKPDMLDEDQRKYLPKINQYLSVKQFTYKDVPDMFKEPFREVKGSAEKGYMLFVYPKIALWHGKDLLKFYNAVGEFEYPVISKRTLNNLLYSSKIDFTKSSPSNHRSLKYTKEEEDIILAKANTFSKTELIKLGTLPLTAKFIIDHRPYHKIEDLRKFKQRANTVGSVILFAKLAQIVQSEAFVAIFATLGIVSFILLLFYKSLVAAIVSLVPLILGIFTMLGIMGITNVKVNFLNILVFPIIIGYAIQNAIYIYYRYLEERHITRTLLKVGPAVIASTLTTLVGWSALLLAEHRGLHSIGVAASIGIGVTLLVALTLLPALLEKYFSKEEEPILHSNIGLNLDMTTPESENRMAQFVEDYLEFQQANEEPKKPRTVSQKPTSKILKEKKSKKKVVAKKKKPKAKKKR